MEGRNKSRSRRRVFRRTPKGKTVLRFEERKPKKAHCTNCHSVLVGMARARPILLKNMPKTKKRPERPYAGMLCSACMRRFLIAKARG